MSLLEGLMIEAILSRNRTHQHLYHRGSSPPPPPPPAPPLPTLYGATRPSSVAATDYAFNNSLLMLAGACDVQPTRRTPSSIRLLTGRQHTPPPFPFNTPSVPSNISPPPSPASSSPLMKSSSGCGGGGVVKMMPAVSHMPRSSNAVRPSSFGKLSMRHQVCCGVDSGKRTSLSAVRRNKIRSGSGSSSMVTAMKEMKRSGVIRSSMISGMKKTGIAPSMQELNRDGAFTSYVQMKRGGVAFPSSSSGNKKGVNTTGTIARKAQPAKKSRVSIYSNTVLKRGLKNHNRGRVVLFN